MAKLPTTITGLIGQRLKEADAIPALKGGALCSIAIALFTLTVAIPANWIDWFRWPLYLMFLAGLPRIILTLLK